MSAKPPTMRAVASTLKKAGLAEWQGCPKCSFGEVHGFVLSRDGGHTVPGPAVWWRGPSKRRAEMHARYAEVLRAAGYAIYEPDGHLLVVSVPEATVNPVPGTDEED